MSNNELDYFTKTSKVFTHKEGREYTKYKNTQPTTKQLCWRDVKTGGTVAFIGV